MLRFLVTAHLILTALVGPGLCCCTLIGATATCGGRRDEGQKKNRSCCHHRHSHAPDQSSHHSAPETPGCPCQNHQAIPVALLRCNDIVASQVDPGHFPSPLSFLPEATVIVLPLTVKPLALPHEWGSRLAPSGREILRALHELRC